MTGRRRQDDRQLPLAGLFAVEKPAGARPGELDIDAMARGAISAALKRSPLSRYNVAARMSELVGQEISKHMLDAYSAESRNTHKFPAQYLPALVIATGDATVLSLIAEKCGCIVLEESMLTLIERARIREQIETLEERDHALRTNKKKGGERHA